MIPIETWLHMYFIHSCGWFSFIIAAYTYNNGIPKLKEIHKEIMAAAILALIAALASSQGHMHYLEFFTQVLAK